MFKQRIRDTTMKSFVPRTYQALLDYCHVFGLYFGVDSMETLPMWLIIIFYFIRPYQPNEPKKTEPFKTQDLEY